MTIGKNNRIEAVDYNTMQDKIAGVLGTGSANKGYGQTVASGQVAAGNTITATQMKNLRADLRKIAYHQTNLDTTAPDVNAGDTIFASDWTNYTNQAILFETNRFNIDSNQAFKTTNLQPVFVTWNGKQTHNVIVEFTTANNARYFFNAGGEIILEPTHTGATRSKGASWRDLLASCIPIKVKSNSTTATAGTGSSIGWYNLTTADQTVFTITATDAYAGNTFSVKARCDVANNNTGTARYLYLTIELNDSGTNPSADLNVDGRTTSKVSNYRAVGSYVIVAQPTVTDNYVTPAATYNLTASPATQSNEGTSVTFTLTTTNLEANTPVPYTIASTVGVVDSADFGGASLSGTFTTNDIGVGTATYTLTADTKTEGDETFTLSLTNGAAAITYKIVDTSLSAGYTLSISPSSGNESSTATITLTTTGVANGTIIPFVITGTAIPTDDFTSMSVNGNAITKGVTGNFIVNSNQSTLTIVMNPDLKNEGTETLTVGLSGSYSANTVTYTITDSSVTALSSVSWGAVSYKEGQTGVVNWAVNGTDFTSAIVTITSPDGSIPPFNSPSLTDTSLRTYTTPSLTGLGIHTAKVTLYKGPTPISDKTSTVNVGSGATYSLTRSATSAQETNAFSFTLTTANVAAGTAVPFTITRDIQTVPLANDFSSWILNGSSIAPSLTGSFIVGSTATNQAKLEVTPSKDRIDEGNVLFTLTLNSPLNANSVSTTITDLNTADPFSFAAKTNQAPNTPITSDNVTITGLTINRSITITATDGTVDAGTSALSGTFAASKTVTTSATGTILVAARVTSGAVSTSNTVTITVEGVSGTFTVSTSGAPTYAWTVYPTSINEGTPYTYSVGTTNVPNGTTLYWSFSGPPLTGPDFTALTGDVTINNNVGSFTITPTADNLTEGNEYFRVLLKSGSQTGPYVIPSSDSALITIVDISQTPATPTYSLTPSATNVNEGSSVTFTATATDVANPDATLYWQIAYITGQATNVDFTVVGSTLPMSNGTGTFTVTPKADSLTEGAQTFTVNLRNGTSTAAILATSVEVTINDTSTTPASPTYTLTPSASSVNEGSSVTFTVGGTNITNGTYIWAVTQPSQFAVNSGTVVVSGNSGSFSVTPIADATTDGAMTFYAILRSTDGATDLVNSSNVTINDTSQTPAATYTLTPAASSVNEGSSLTFTVGGTNIPNGTYYWTITNAGNFGTSSGSFTITSNSGSFSVTPTADATTEGAETFTASIRSGSVSGTVLATSSSVTINDTSQTPTPTYSWGTYPTVMQESSSGTFYVNTTNVPNGTTLYWSIGHITTTPDDFAEILGPGGETVLGYVTNGSFTINNNSGNFTVELLQYLNYAEISNETFTVGVYPAVGPALLTSNTITIVQTYIIYDWPGTYTVIPPGQPYIYGSSLIYGGGGGGGGHYRTADTSDRHAGGGGGSGGAVRNYFNSTTISGNITVTVGSGGAAGSCFYEGFYNGSGTVPRTGTNTANNGTQSSITFTKSTGGTYLAVAGGGQGARGNNNDDNSGVSGAGGSSSGGYINYNGNPGGTINGNRDYYTRTSGGDGVAGNSYQALGGASQTENFLSNQDYDLPEAGRNGVVIISWGTSPSGNEGVGGDGDTNILYNGGGGYGTGGGAGGGGGDGGDGSVSVNAYMPYNKLAGTVIAGDPLSLLSLDGTGTMDGIVISNRISQQKLLTLVSSSGIRLTCSDNTPLTLQDGSSINSTEALGNLLPVQDSNGFRWEEIVEVIDAGHGEVATIFCDNQCYAAGDEPNRWIWTHNLFDSKI